MSSLSFRQSLYLLAVISGLGIILASLGGWWQGNTATVAAARIYDERTAPTVELMRAVDALHRARQTILIALSEDKEEAAAAHLDKLPALDKTTHEALAACAAAAPDQREAINRLEGLIGEYIKARGQSVQMIQVGDLPSALGNIKLNAGPKFEKVLQALTEVIQNQARLAQTDHETTTANLKQRAGLLAVLSVVVLTGIAVLFGWVLRAIFRQLGGEPREAAQALAAVAGGKLGVQIHAAPEGSLLADLKHMSGSLSDMVREIKTLALEIDERSMRTFQHMQAAAQRGSTQADAATSVAAGIEELATSIESVSSNATQTGEAALSSLEKARSGHHSIQELESSMTSLSTAADQSMITIQSLVESSNNIMSIVVQINEIADQTNLLALNAAIEAARAGEQGRGFAVVADEVRKLAEKTSSATHQIRQMLESVRHTAVVASEQMQSSHERIQIGTSQVTSVTRSIGEIEQQLTDIANAARETSEALHEQRVTSQTIAAHMEQIATSANENSATAVTVVGEAGSVSQAADALAQRMSRFQL